MTKTDVSKYEVDGKIFATLEEAEQYVLDNCPEHFCGKDSFMDLCENIINYVEV